MHVTIVSPASGAKVTGNSVTVHVRVSGYRDTCSLAGKHVMGMEETTTGHYHVLLDLSVVLYGLGLVSLVGVLGFGVVHGGAANWLKIGAFQFHIVDPKKRSWPKGIDASVGQMVRGRITEAASGA